VRPTGHDDLDELLETVQNHLHVVQADLANPDPDPDDPAIEAAHVETLEERIDALDEELEPLRSFILPGGGEAGARLHHARTVTRRAERRVVELARSEPINEMTVTYLNRLSDLLFTLGRVANARDDGEPEESPRTDPALLRFSPIFRRIATPERGSRTTMARSRQSDSMDRHKEYIRPIPKDRYEQALRRRAVLPQSRGGTRESGVKEEPAPVEDRVKALVGIDANDEEPEPSRLDRLQSDLKKLEERAEGEAREAVASAASAYQVEYRGHDAAEK